MDDPVTAATLAVVDAYYTAGREGRLSEFAGHLDEGFVVTAPDYFPWGGRHEGAAFFRDDILPNLPEVLDFSRCRYERFFGAGEHAVALIEIGVTGTRDVVSISEHWTVRGGRAMSLWVAYFEPQALLIHLGTDPSVLLGRTAD